MFFSVKTAMKIGGKAYTPCICYHLIDSLIPTVEKLVKEGKAYQYEERVSFQNGKVLPSLKEREAKAKAEKKAEKQAKKEAKAKEAKEAEETEGF